MPGREVVLERTRRPGTNSKWRLKVTLAFISRTTSADAAEEEEEDDLLSSHVIDPTPARDARYAS